MDNKDALEATKITIAHAELEKKFDNNWENAPSVAMLRQELEDALPYHTEIVSRIDTWLENLNNTSNASEKNTNKKKKTRSEFQPRLIRKQAEWRYPALTEPFLNSPDMFSVKPRTHLDKDRAKQAAAVINYQFNNDIDKVEFIDEFVRAAVDEGTVIVRTGWKYRTRTEVREVPEVEYRTTTDPVMQQRMLQLVQAVNQNPEILQQLDPMEAEAVQLTIQENEIVIPVLTGKMIEEEYEVVIEDAPDLEVCDYRSVIIDPTCKGKISKANFVIYKFETSKAELQSTGRYKNLDLVNLEDTSILKESDDIIDNLNLGTFNFRDKPRKRIVAYEYWGYWDVYNNGTVVPILATFVGDVMIGLEKNPFNHGQIPFDAAQLMPKRKQTHGEPDGELIHDNQKIVGALSRGMIDLMAKSANGQTAHAKGFLDPLNRRRFLNQENYEFNPVTHPEQAIYQHKYPEIPASAYNMIQLHQNEAESFTGVKAFQQGISGDSLGSSVGGIRSALDAAGKRELSILRRLVSCMVSIAKKIISMNAQFLDSDKTIRITDEEYIDINPEDLTGEFDLVLDISTAEADNEKAAELAFMLQTMGNTAPFELTKMLLIDIARLRKMHVLAKQLEAWQPQPDPYTEQMKQIEMRLKAAEAMEVETQARKNLAQAERDLANARKANADADMADLDFVEQESGTKHARDLENMKAQSEGNIQHEIAKKMLNVQ